MTGPGSDSDRASSLGTQPFEAGDIFLAATDVDDQNVNLRAHKGPGRILHYDKDFVLKGELRTGHEGLLVGLAVDQESGTLYAGDPGSKTVTAFGPDGMKIELPFVAPQRNIGSLVTGPDRTLLMGVHSKIGEDQPLPYLYRAGLKTGVVESFDVEVSPGPPPRGFLCVTSLFIEPDGKTLLYTTEDGRRVMRYDLDAREQRGDFMVLAEDDPRATGGVALDDDGNLLMATSTGAERISPAGETIQKFDVPETKGWARMERAADGTSFWLGNFFEGIIQRRDLKSGGLISEHDIGRKYSLTAVAEYTG